MRPMKKLLFAVPLLSLLLTGCNNKVASGYDSINKDGIETEPGNFDFDGNFVVPEIIIDGNDNDEAWSGEHVSEILQFNNDTNKVTVKLLRGEHALFFFYKVTDKYICSKGNDNGNDVSASDSVEIYIDSLNNGGTAPQTDDYQINLGVHDKTRILVGSGTSWSNWNGLCQYEVKITGTLNDNSDIDVGYNVEGMIPWNQIGCDKNSSFGVAFGNVDKKTNESAEEVSWAGLTFGGILIEPQTPNNYITYSGNSFSARGIHFDKISVSGTITNENDQPVNNATILAGEGTYHTNMSGQYTISGVDPLEALPIQVSYDGYKTHKYTIHSADMIIANGNYQYDVQLIPGSGDDEATPNYVYIGETTKKLIHALTLEVSRHDKYGLSMKLTIDDTKFDKFQQYELYIDTGAKTRTVTDAKTWCIALLEDNVSFITNDPKASAVKHATTFVELKVSGNTYELYVPYALISATPETVVGYSFGIWDTLIKDWEPMNRAGEYALVENPSLYVRQNPDGTIAEDASEYAEPYDYASDTAPYVDLGTFSGKTAAGIQFSKLTAKVNHTDANYIYIQFTTNQSKWRKDERIEMYIDSGASSRTTRDGESYRMDINTGNGKIVDFWSYTNPYTQLNKEEVTIYMDTTHMLVKIPYATLSSSIVQSTILGFSFGVFNNSAGDWDGYGYNDTYIDPAKPNLYVRVDGSNNIQQGVDDYEKEKFIIVSVIHLLNYRM